jgi:hypothetical protein
VSVVVDQRDAGERAFRPEVAQADHFAIDREAAVSGLYLGYNALVASPGLSAMIRNASGKRTHAFFDSFNTDSPATICRNSCTSGLPDGAGRKTTSAWGLRSGSVGVDDDATVLTVSLDRQGVSSPGIIQLVRKGPDPLIPAVLPPLRRYGRRQLLRGLEKLKRCKYTFFSCSQLLLVDATACMSAFYCINS